MADHCGETGSMRATRRPYCRTHGPGRATDSRLGLESEAEDRRWRRPRRHPDSPLFAQASPARSLGDTTLEAVLAAATTMGPVTGRRAGLFNSRSQCLTAPRSNYPLRPRAGACGGRWFDAVLPERPPALVVAAAAVREHRAGAPAIGRRAGTRQEPRPAAVAAALRRCGCRLITALEYDERRWNPAFPRAHAERGHDGSASVPPTPLGHARGRRYARPEARLVRPRTSLRVTAGDGNAIRGMQHSSLSPSGRKVPAPYEGHDQPQGCRATLGPA